VSEHKSKKMTGFANVRHIPRIQSAVDHVGRIRRRPRLGGLLNYYYRAA
jgi:hypothetical protein